MTSKIELHLVCTGVQPPHDFKKTFEGDVDWDEVSRTMRLDRCELHPEMPCWDWD
jgi:hypothetical protein